MNVTYYIGIDPDNKESGVGVVNRETRECLSMRFTFSQLTDWLQRVREDYGEDAKVFVEGGWLNRSNWHVLGKYMTTAKAAAIGRSAGMNHQTGILIAEMSRHYGNDTTVIKPLLKCWQGADGKITQEEAEYFMGKLPRMNQDQRDALLLAWVAAGLSVRVRVPAATARGRSHQRKTPQ